MKTLITKAQADTTSSTDPSRWTLLIRVTKGMRDQDGGLQAERKLDLLRRLAQLMPGIDEVRLNDTQREAGWDLAIKKGTASLERNRWGLLNARLLNKQLRGMKTRFVLAMTPDPTRGLCYVVACDGKVSKFDIEALNRVDMIRNVVLPPNGEAYMGEAVLVYAPFLPHNMEGLRLAVNEALDFTELA